MKILFVAVNFNSYNELTDYLASIEKAAEKAGADSISVIVADNSTKKECVDTARYRYISVAQSRQDNIGYLPGALNVINRIDNILEYDYVAITNVDLTVSEDFFIRLKERVDSEDVAWIAPQIFSKSEGRDINPKVVSRYSTRKLRLIYYMYKFPILFYAYTLTVYKRKKIRLQYPEMDIYAGHGSFILLTRNFFERVKEIHYPIFLFGEELFLAEKIREVGKKVRYVPSLVVSDNEHVSTSLLKKNIFFQYNRESIKFILDCYYYE